VATTAALAIELLSKFTEGAWLVVLVVPLLVLMFDRIYLDYERIGRRLRLGEPPSKPQRRKSLVVVPVGGMSALTVEGISAALSLGDEVIAVTVSYSDPEEEVSEETFRDQWNTWHPDVPLITLYSPHRTLATPIVDYLRRIERDDKYHRLVVLIPEMQPEYPWRRILYNQRGFVLDRAIQRGTSNVVICRLRFSPAAWSSPGEPPGGAPAQHPRQG
jgi:hypothetical protein